MRCADGGALKIELGTLRDMLADDEVRGTQPLCARRAYVWRIALTLLQHVFATVYTKDFEGSGHCGLAGDPAACQ